MAAGVTNSMNPAFSGCPSAGLHGVYIGARGGKDGQLFFSIFSSKTKQTVSFQVKLHFFKPFFPPFVHRKSWKFFILGQPETIVFLYGQWTKKSIIHNTLVSMDLRQLRICPNNFTERCGTCHHQQRRWWWGVGRRWLAEWKQNSWEPERVLCFTVSF